MSVTLSRPVSSMRSLRRAVSGLSSRYQEGSQATVRDFLAPLGAEAAGLGAALLALPFLSPLSLGPLTSAASLLILLLGIRVLSAREGAPLPNRLLNVPVSESVHGVMLRLLRRFSRMVRRFSRPRYEALVEGHRGRWVCGVGMIAGALLLAVPIPLLPLTNTFPALGIICFALGRSERDGLLSVLGALALAFTLMIFVGLATALAWFGQEAVRSLVPFVS